MLMRFPNRADFLPHCTVTLAVIAAAVLAADCGAAGPKAEHVIHISVDGLHPGVLQELIDAGDAPNFKRLQEEGAWTGNARTDYSHTVTLPNHTAMLTGRPVSRPEGMPDTVHHGWMENSLVRPGITLHNHGNRHAGYIASVFDVAHDAGLSTALYTSKDKFAIYDESYNDKNGSDHANGRDKIDTFFFQDDGPPNYSASMNARFLADMSARRFNYAFVHFRDTDSTGHSLGWGSNTWRQAVVNIDRHLGKIIELVERDPELRGHTAMIVTADHGGLWFGHSDPTLPDHYTVPVLVWGAGVEQGDLYEMNAGTREDPGKSRIDFTAARQPIRNGGTGNLALKMLGLGQIPGSLINARQDLRVTPGKE